MKIRSAVPENGCLVFLWRTEKKRKSKKKTKKSVKHIRIRLIGGCVNKHRSLQTSRKVGLRRQAGTL